MFADDPRSSNPFGYFKPKTVPDIRFITAVCLEYKCAYSNSMGTIYLGTKTGRIYKVRLGGISEFHHSSNSAIETMFECGGCLFVCDANKHIYTYDTGTLCELKDFTMDTLHSKCTKGNIFAFWCDSVFWPGRNSTIVKWSSKSTVLDLTDTVHRVYRQVIGLVTWGLLLCVSFSNGDIGVSFTMPQLLLFMKKPKSALTDSIRMVPSMDFLYVQYNRYCVRCNASGEWMDGFYLQLNDMFAGAVVLHNGALYERHYDRLTFSTEVAFKESKTLCFGENILGFKWGGNLFSVSEDRRNLIMWNMLKDWSPSTHRLFSAELRTKIKTIICLSFHEYLPLNKIPQDILFTIIRCIVLMRIEGYGTLVKF